MSQPDPRDLLNDIDSLAADLYAVADQCRRPAGLAAADRRDAPRLAQRRSVRPDAERRHGLDPAEMLGPQFLLLSTQGGIRADDGTPIALGYHTGPLGSRAAGARRPRVMKQAGGGAVRRLLLRSLRRPHAGHAGMFDSLPYRNDAAIVFRRLIRSLPTRRGVLGVATCDKGLPAMMLALAGIARSAVRAGARRRDAAADRRRRRRQDPIDRRPLRPRRDLTLEEAADAGLPRLRLAGRRLPVPRHGGHVAGGRRSAGPVAAALGPGPLAASRSGSTWPGAAPRR